MLRRSMSALAIMALLMLCLVGCKKNADDLSSTVSDVTDKKPSGTTSYKVNSDNTVEFNNGETGVLTEDGKGIIVESSSDPESMMADSEYVGSSKVQSSADDYIVSPSKTPTTSSQTTSSSSSQVSSSTEGRLTYEEYTALSPQKQQEYFNTFATVGEFSAWYNDAKAQYDAKNSNIQIGGDGSIDLGDYLQ